MANGSRAIGHVIRVRTRKGARERVCCMRSASTLHERTGWQEAQEWRLVTRPRRMMRSFGADETKLVDRCPPALDCPEAAVAHGEAAGEHGGSERGSARGTHCLTGSIGTRVNVFFW